jgi:predicted MPP superfamily phosphohydrolase
MRTQTELIKHEQSGDGIDRRGFLECMAWAGTGMVWTITGGLLRSRVLPLRGQTPEATESGFHFVQISDTHIGFNKEANKDVIGTLKAAIERINALPIPPEFILHTGDLTHLAEPEEFDTLDQLLKQATTSEIIFVPGEHDVIGDNGKRFRDVLAEVLRVRAGAASIIAAFTLLVWSTSWRFAKAVWESSGANNSTG